MKITEPHFFLFFFSISFSSFFLYSEAQLEEPSTTGYNCTRNQTRSPCQTYVFYRAMAPDFLDLASIGDLFSVSRVMISNPSNISSPSSPLVQNQPLFIPITCSCNQVPNDINNRTISYANLSYTIKEGDTFYMVSTTYYQNLTTYQSVQLVNPTLIAINLTIGVSAIFPIFCKCPTDTQLNNKVNYLVSYVYQPSDNLTEVASTFGVQTKAITDFNGENFQPFDTLFIPVSQLPVLSQPSVVAPPPGSDDDGDDNKGAVVGLGIGLGVALVLLLLVGGVWYYRERSLKKKRVLWGDEEKQKGQSQMGQGYKGNSDYNNKVAKEMEESLMADVSGCLDKYRVFGVNELEDATDGFHESCLIQGSVYKATIDGEVYAIKKMNWNACEELKILQKVNLLIFLYYLNRKFK